MAKKENFKEVVEDKEIELDDELSKHISGDTIGIS